MINIAPTERRLCSALFEGGGGGVMILYRRARGVELIHCGFQTFLVLCIYAGCVFLIPGRADIALVGRVDNYALYGILIALGLGFDYIRSNPGKQNLLHLDLPSNIVRSSRQMITTLVVIMFAIIALKDNSISRLFFFGFIPVFFALLFVTNKFLPSAVARFVFHERHKNKTILVGSSKNVSAMWAWLQRKRDYGIDIVGMLTDEEQPSVPDGCVVLGKTQDLGEKIASTRTIQVFLLETPAHFREIKHLSEMCDNLGARLLVVCNWMDLVGRKMDVFGDDGVDLISFFNEPLECPFNRTMKRLLDVAVSLPVVLFLLPLTNLLVWLLQKMQSPGPLFFTQIRSGLNGEQFSIIKYRTMYFANHDETLQATPGDERVFPAGRWLRRFSIDELPQFINVLKGDMSVVGPRPHMIAHDRVFGSKADGYPVRRFVKPGITGLAQVRGLRGETRTAVEIKSRVVSDTRYIENWSLILDAIIILRTLWQMILPPSRSY